MDVTCGHDRELEHGQSNIFRLSVHPVLKRKKRRMRERERDTAGHVWCETSENIMLCHVPHHSVSRWYDWYVVMFCSRFASHTKAAVLFGHHTPGSTGGSVARRTRQPGACTQPVCEGAYLTCVALSLVLSVLTRTAENTQAVD